MYEKYFKRALDFLLSLVLILALSPIFTVVFI